MTFPLNFDTLLAQHRGALDNVGLASLNLPREFSARLEYLQLISEEMLPHLQ